jgi:hypothetical protein
MELAKLELVYNTYFLCVHQFAVVSMLKLVKAIAPNTI